MLKDKQVELETLVLDLSNKQRQLTDQLKKKQQAGESFSKEEMDTIELTVGETQNTIKKIFYPEA